MGKGNVKIKQFLRDKKRYADLFNGTLFNGKQVIRPEELDEIDSETSIIVTDKDNIEKDVQKYRDITMIWKQGVKLCVLACENQNKIHYAMPVRMMLYDSLNYTDQIRQIWKNKSPDTKVTEEEFLSRFLKEEKIYPIISIIFYYGTKKWDASTDLYGLFHEETFFESREVLNKYISNYTLNLIDATDIGESSRFQSDLQLILGMLKYKNEKELMREFLYKNQEFFQSVDTETFQAIGELLHSEKELKLVAGKADKKESWDMCKAFEDMYNDGVDAGREQGITAFIEVCKELEISKETICQKLKDKFSITEEKAIEYMDNIMI